VFLLATQTAPSHELPAQPHTDPVIRRNLILLMMAGAALSITSGIYETSFNNFLSETFKISAETRGALEFPRELPGFLVAVSAGLLAFLSISRAAVVAALCAVVGLFGLGHLAPTYSVMVAWLMLYSMGVHLNMPLESSLALATATEGQVGRRLGQLEGVKTSAVIIGASITWLGMDYWGFSFSRLFTIAAVLALCASVALFRMNTRVKVSTDKNRLAKRFFLRKEYRLYYLLCVLYGARKQVFITFGPWVLIKVLGEPASTIAKLWIVAAALGILFRPALGRLIDRIGERRILMADAIMLVLVCIGYGFGPNMGWGAWGIRLAYSCFVADQLLFATGMARTSYCSQPSAESSPSVIPSGLPRWMPSWQRYTATPHSASSLLFCS
jgi:predicted MFS family arabinose efflux permease